MQILLERWHAWWRAGPARRQRPLLAVVEGGHDIEFLTRISRLVHAADTRLPHLERAALTSKLLFLPAGGANLGDWTLRLAALELPEFYLFDREMSPETKLRKQLVATLNARPQTAAFLTRKRSLENYLHPAAICAVTGIDLSFGDDDSVASLAAQALFESKPGDPAWSALSARARKRLRDRSKRWLNTRAVERMTLAQLYERDPDGEVIGWFRAVAELLRLAR